VIFDDQARAAVGRFLGWLRTERVDRGDRIAVLAHNRIETVFLALAARELGARVLLLNTRLTAAELAPILLAHPSKLTLADDDLRERVPGAIGFPEPASLTPSTAAADPAEPWIELLTSGTTGPPKCVALTPANFAAHAAAHAAHSGASSDDRSYLCLPMFHIGAWAMITRAALHRSSLILAPAFDPQRFLDDAECHQLTHASLVSTQLHRVLDALGDRPFPRSLEALLIGGGPVHPALMARARAVKAPVLQTYGLTEACSQVCTQRVDDIADDSCGRPLPGVEVTIVTDRGPAAIGEPGRIHVAGPTVAPMFKGHLDTGDLGFFDQYGHLHVLARRTDLIVTGGENVYPWEVERALLDLPTIFDAAVGAVADPAWGQRVAAAIVSNASDDQLTAALRQKLAGFKLPRTYARVDAIPRTATGKVDRRALAELLEASCNGSLRQA